MQLGFLTAPFPDTPLMEVADWAASVGFETLEIACWPKSTGPTRRYAGTTHIDVANTSAEQGREIVATLADKELSVSGLRSTPTSRTARWSTAILRRSSSRPAPWARRW